MGKVTEQEVIQAQEKWAQGIVEIGSVFEGDGDFTKRAQEHIDSLYAYDETPVLFKPTKAADQPFRSTKEAALSYFVATNGWADEDKGFAITPWKKVRFANSGIVTNDNSALAMGEYYFENKEGSEVKVEYSFGYVRGKDGDLKINLHHSSLPFQTG